MLYGENWNSKVVWMLQVLLTSDLMSNSLAARAGTASSSRSRQTCVTVTLACINYVYMFKFNTLIKKRKLCYYPHPPPTSKFLHMPPTFIGPFRCPKHCLALFFICIILTTFPKISIMSADRTSAVEIINIIDAAHKIAYILNDPQSGPAIRHPHRFPTELLLINRRALSKGVAFTVEK